jgi:cell wall-associated NlpC family hydrolase
VQRTVTPQSSSSGKGATISSAALGQLGVAQDCTMLVTNALRAAGINHHGWPASYLGLGTQVSAAQAQPGDLVYYADGGAGVPHIGVYIGGGQAVHGGWNGGTTAIAGVNVGSGPVYVRVG